MSQSEIWEKQGCLREKSITSKNGKSIMKVFHFVMLTKKGKKNMATFVRPSVEKDVFWHQNGVVTASGENLDSFGQKP